MKPDPNILLDLRLDTLAEGQVRDASPNQRHATAHGNLALVYAAGDRNIIWATDNLNQGNLFLQVWADAVRENAKTLTATGALATKQWLHLAATIAPSGHFQLYRNGLALFDTPQDGVLPPKANRSACFIGHSTWGNDGDFKGRMAFVRVYNRPLSESELWQSYAASLVAPAHVTHPLSYELYDDNQEPVLYIEDNFAGRMSASAPPRRKARWPWQAAYPPVPAMPRRPRRTMA